MPEENFTPDRSKLYHYKLDRILGQGGTGVVYRGIDTQKGEVVAIKRFRDNFFRNAMHKRDLKKSIKRFKKLDNQNVVKILDFQDTNETDGTCMIMEYVDGANLKWYLMNRPYNLQERLLICIQICNGMQYLHDHDVIHHDFKPANILFTRRGIAKICDFSLYGSSLMLELFDRGAGEQITPMYVAPEIIRRERATKLSDQYSLGVTMYMMFANRLPYISDNLPKLYQCHLTVTPQHPAEANPACPRNLGDVVMKLMAKKPAERFTDMDQVRIALSDVGKRRI